MRTLEVLREADLVACEDTRRTRILLERHGVAAARLLSFHDHNEEQRLRTLLPILREGKDVAVVSDAGMPGLSDPGFTLIRACALEGLPVTVLPGPSAISTALVLSGLPTDRFAFLGFLARGKAKLLDQLERFEGTGAALVAFESPRRVRSTLAAIGERWPDRRLAVCRELTKLHEEAVRGTAAEVLGQLADDVRGEIVLVLAPTSGLLDKDTGMAPGGGGDLEGKVRQAFVELGDLGVGTKKAAAIVAGLTGLSARRAYELGLEAVGQADRTPPPRAEAGRAGRPPRSGRPRAGR